MSPIIHRFFNGIGIVLSLFPLVVLFGFGTYLLRTRAVAGHWPSYGHPESWSQGFTLHYALLRPWFHVFPVYFLPFLALLYDGALWAITRRFPKIAFVVLACSAVISWTWWYADPGHFLDWFVD